MTKFYGYHHWLFDCRQCSKPILLLAEKLGEVIVPLSSHIKELHSAGVVCPHCKTVESYSADKDSSNYDPTVKVVVPDQTVAPFFAGWLRCEEENCKTPLGLFSTEIVPIDDDKKRGLLATWKWGNVKCPSGHSIPKPQTLKILDMGFSSHK